MFEPLWSDAIHAEWMTNLHARLGIPAGKVEYRRGQMEQAFPAANVATPPALVAAVQGMCGTAAQRKDAHVVATAAAGGADVIVTHNTKDFASEVLRRYGLSKVRPDPFCTGPLRRDPGPVLAGLRAHRVSLKRMPMVPLQYVEHLAADRMGLPKLAQALAGHHGAL